MSSSPTRIRTARFAALAALAASVYFLVRANDAEASAIFDAGGDAGMWGLGIFVAGTVFAPGGVLGLIAVAFHPRQVAGTVVALTAGILILVPTVWLGMVVYPPDRRTTEGQRLDPAQWDHVADLYLASLGLAAAAGALLILSAFPALMGGTQPELSPR